MTCQLNYHAVAEEHDYGEVPFFLGRPGAVAGAYGRALRSPTTAMNLEATTGTCD